MWEKIGLIAAILLPFWNIPLIIKIVRRRSSDDISRLWAFGVWTCLLLMAPSGLRSQDMTWRIFNVVNLIIFSVVVIFVVIYRKR